MNIFQLREIMQAADTITFAKRMSRASSDEISLEMLRGINEHISTVEKHRDELLVKLSKHQRDSRLGAAIEYAAQSLPPDYEIELSIERDAGTARLYLPETDAYLDELDGDDLADHIHNAVNVAIAKAEAGS